MASLIGYRIDEYGTVYRYSADHRAYIAIGKKLPGETDSEAVERIENDEQ
jgi:hypothetical protein